MLKSSSVLVVTKLPFTKIFTLRTAFLFSFLLLLSRISSAQDTLQVKTDSLPKDTHSPTFAGVASAILPGAGQVYNRKYWKVPIVYAGLGTAAYFTWFNAHIYYSVHDNLDSRVAGDSIPQPESLIINGIFSKTTVILKDFSSEELLVLEDEYRKYFTISIIVGSVIYFLNILDAVVDAHLFHFDVSDNLSLDYHPQLFSSFNGRTAAGLSLSLSLK